MPIYEYRCQACGHKFDHFQKMSDPKPPCPQCEGEVDKLISAAGFILKGGGWYKDHYGLKSSSDTGSSASESTSSSSESTSSSSSDSSSSSSSSSDSSSSSSSSSTTSSSSE